MQYPDLTANGMTLIDDYKADAAYRASFNRLAAQTFGIDFAAWHRQGYWNDRYVCHSIAHAGEVVANVSVSFMDLIVSGAQKRAVQIGTVMTHPAYRGRGLSRLLMDRVLQRYERSSDFIFLFANADALEFYPKFGFEAVAESRFALDVASMPRQSGGVRKLSMAEEIDQELIKRAAREARPVSQVFGAYHHFGLLMFYAMNVFDDCLYYLERQQAVAICKYEGESLHLYDALSPKPIDGAAMLADLLDEQTKCVRFNFTPDLFTGRAVSEPFNPGEDRLFVRPASALGGLESGAFQAPKLAHA